MYNTLKVTILPAIIASSTVFAVWLIQRHVHSDTLDNCNETKGEDSTSKSNISTSTKSTYVDTSTVLNDTAFDSSNNVMLSFPSHLRREFRKDERRRQMIPQLVMKSKLYDNIVMTDPNGSVLSTIAKKKADWYVRKQLANWTTETSIQLNFMPENKQKRNEKHGKNVVCKERIIADTNRVRLLYNQTAKHNRCVCCGSTEQYMRHYIVPFCYRTLFPAEFKTHLPHDVVLLCAYCQLEASQWRMKRQTELEKVALLQGQQEGKDTVDITQPYVIDTHVRHVRTACSALLKRRENMPRSRQDEYMQLVMDHFQIQFAVDVTNLVLEEGAALEHKQPNPHFVSGPECVVTYLLQHGAVATTHDKIAEFVQEWRRYFLATMRPRYLPTGWSINSPVKSN